MLIKVTFNLPFGLHDEPEARSITGYGRERADGKGAAVPQGIEEARSRVELLQPCFTPRQMVRLLASSIQQQVARRSRPGDQRLPMIESLGGYFAGMVYAHQGRRLLALSVGHLTCRRTWDGSGSVSGGEDGTKCTVCGRNERI
jgi:hypothetical protein